MSNIFDRPNATKSKRITASDNTPGHVTYTNGLYDLWTTSGNSGTSYTSSDSNWINNFATRDDINDLSTKIKAIEKQLGIINRNLELESRWKQLRDLAEQYEKLADEIAAQEDTYQRLNK